MSHAAGPLAESCRYGNATTWDRQLRRADSHAAKWEYVRNNPVRHGHVENLDDWPYQGELNILEWHD